MAYITSEHGKRLPTIRIHKVVLKDFKSVGYGEVSFDCSKQFVPANTTSDVLGIYGQNGSGKTAFIEALSILKYVMSGDDIPFPYSDCISTNADHSELEFTFDLQYPTEPVIIRKVIYSFCLRVEDGKEIEGTAAELADAFDGLYSKQYIKKRVCVYNELIKIGGDINGENKKCMPVIDTSTINIPFGPATKRKLFYKVNASNTAQLGAIKKYAYIHAKSFIFNTDTLDIFKNNTAFTAYYEVLLELFLYSNRFLFVVDTKSMGIIRANVLLPLFGSDIVVNTVGQNMETIEDVEKLKKKIAPIQEVLPTYVPGLSIYVKELGPVVLDDGTEGKSIELMVKRGDRELPIRCESDGVRKIISVLNLIIDAYNQKSTTVAIDEFDAGIFEYLLGELLQIFAESGKGQLIFTSHNLRPLEVLDKKFICFTTTNPDNRYIHMKNVGASNNLRNLYFREIQMNEQDEEIYKATKKHKIIAALRKAGK